MERNKETNCVTGFFQQKKKKTTPANTLPPSRSHLQAALKTKNWEHRMQKTQKALSIKKLQRELTEEKQAELKRPVIIDHSVSSLFLTRFLPQGVGK